MHTGHVESLPEEIRSEQLANAACLKACLHVQAYLNPVH